MAALEHKKVGSRLTGLELFVVLTESIVLGRTFLLQLSTQLIVKNPISVRVPVMISHSLPRAEGQGTLRQRVSDDYDQ